LNSQKEKARIEIDSRFAYREITYLTGASNVLTRVLNVLTGAQILLTGAQIS
jgi:hypothetical protein